MVDAWLGKSIRCYLKERGTSQVFISGKTGINTVKLNAALNGKRRFTFEEYELICGALSLNTDYFLKPKLPKGVIKDETLHN